MLCGHGTFMLPQACPPVACCSCVSHHHKLARVEGSLLVFGREERLGSKARHFLLKERVARHPHVVAWLGWIDKLQELIQLVEQAPAEGDEEDAAAVLEEALRLVACLRTACMLPSLRFCNPSAVKLSGCAALQSGP
jgi:hypothetical protein